MKEKLLLEEKLLLAQIVDFERSEDNSFAAFDSVKWMKGVMIIGCGTEKSLPFFTSYIRYI